MKNKLILPLLALLGACIAINDLPAQAFVQANSATQTTTDLSVQLQTTRSGPLIIVAYASGKGAGGNFPNLTINMTVSVNGNALFTQSASTSSADDAGDRHHVAVFRTEQTSVGTGNHTITLNPVFTSNNGSSERSSSLLVIAPDEIGSTEELQAVIGLLSDRLTVAEGQILALQGDHTAQQLLIDSLQSNLTAALNRVSEVESHLALSDAEIQQLNTRQTELLERLEQLETAPGGTTKVAQTKRQGLKGTDYLIMGGSAAGAAALGIGIYSLFDQAPADAPGTVPSSNETRPGFHE